MTTLHKQNFPHSNHVP